MFSAQFPFVTIKIKRCAIPILCQPCWLHLMKCLPLPCRSLSGPLADGAAGTLRDEGAMAEQRHIPPSPPEAFVVEVFSEISREVVQSRWCAVNVVLRLGMLSALDIELDATLQMLCD